MCIGGRCSLLAIAARTTRILLLGVATSRFCNHLCAFFIVRYHNTFKKATKFCVNVDGSVVAWPSQEFKQPHHIQLILFLDCHVDLDDIASCYKAELSLWETKAANEAHQGNKASSLACHQAQFRRGVSIMCCVTALKFFIISLFISQLVGQLRKNLISSKVLFLCRVEFRSGRRPNRLTAS